MLIPLKERHIDFIRGYCDALHLKLASDGLFIERIDYLTNQDWQAFLNEPFEESAQDSEK